MRSALLGLAASIAVAAPAAARPALTGQWIVVADRWGNLEYSTLNLVLSGTRLSGDWDGDPVTGTLAGDRVTFTVNSASDRRYAFAGRLAKGVLTGEADFPDSNDPARRAKHAFTARRVPDRPVGGPRSWDFTPGVYANAFTPDRAPVLTIWPGDRVRTTTLDSGGMDAQGVTRALFGNPQTGPFFVAGSAPGDTIVIHIEKLRLNRDWADSLDAIVGRALGRALVPQAGDLGKPVRWRLDRAGGFASPEGATGALKALRVPLRPMLGGLALASGPGAAPLSTGDTGRAGGNMDFPEVVEGNSVSLPVLQPGGLIYLGDGHAAQGDGETSQFALETSLDVEFRVELIKGRSVPMPRIESPTELMVLGQAGSLDEALKFATTGMIQWLQQDYGMTLSEAAQVMGSSLRLSIPNLAGRSVGVAAKLDKRVLPESF